MKGEIFLEKVDYLIEDLTDEVINKVLDSLVENDYAMGTVNEILTTSGKEKIYKSIYNALNSELEFYKNEAREKLVEIEVLKGIKRMVSLNMEEIEEFNEPLNELYEEYNKKIKKVRFIENIISDLKRTY